MVGLNLKKKRRQAGKWATINSLGIMKLFNSSYETASLGGWLVGFDGVWGVKIKRPVYRNFKRRMAFFLILTHGFSRFSFLSLFFKFQYWLWCSWYSNSKSFALHSGVVRFGFTYFLSVRSLFEYLKGLYEFDIYL